MSCWLRPRIAKAFLISISMPDLGGSLAAIFIVAVIAAVESERIQIMSRGSPKARTMAAFPPSATVLYSPTYLPAVLA